MFGLRATVLPLPSSLFNDAGVSGDSLPGNILLAPFGLILYQEADFCYMTGIFLVPKLVFKSSLRSYIMAQFCSFTGILNSCQVKWNL